MYDDYRRILRDLNTYDQIGRALDESYLRHMRDAAQIIHERMAGLDYAARLAAVDFSADLRRAIDPLFGYQNLLDIKAIDQGVAQAISDTFRPQALAAVEKLLAGTKLEQLALGRDGLMRDLLQVSKFATREVASLNSAYEHLRSLQQQIDKSSAALSATFSDALRPLLAAQASWARAAQMPSWKLHHDHLAADVRALFDNISELYDTVDHINIEELDEEEAEQAIALANERLGAAFEETNPLRLVRLIAEFLNQIKAGTIKLAPHARHVLVVILLNLVSNLIYDKLMEPPSSGPSRVAKPIVREAKRIRREIRNIPADTRVVTASGLIVRREPNKTSAPIGHLYAGDIVSLEKTRTRSWSLVVFQSADGDVLLRGWVFSRYLMPLQRRRAPFDAGCGDW